MMSAGLNTMSLSEHMGMDGRLAPWKSVRWRHAHCTGKPLGTQSAPWNACEVIAGAGARRSLVRQRVGSGGRSASAGV